MPDDQRTRTAEALAQQALRYATGDLSPDEVAAFELWLADDQHAREALVEAVQWSAMLGGEAPPLPVTSYRAKVREALLPAPVPRPKRLRRALAWAGSGSAVASLLVAAAVVLFVPTPPPAPTIALAPQPPLAPAHDGAPTPEMARMWSDLQDHKKLVQAVDEEIRRKQAEERGVRPPMPALEVRPLPPTMDN